MTRALSSYKILHVEDSAVDAEAVRRHLSREPHADVVFEVVHASTLAAATTLLAGGLPDALLLDCHLPDGDGLELLRHVRATDAFVPILMLSGSSRGQELDDEALTAGADDFLHKEDVHSRSLGRILRFAIERARARRRADEAGLSLRLKEDQLQLALETAQLGAWYRDVETGEIVCGDGVKMLFGRPPGSDFRFSHLAASLAEEDREAWHATIARAVTSRSSYRHQFRVRLPDGSVRWLEGSGLVSEDGKSVSGVTADVTARRLAEERLRLDEERARLAIAATGLGTYDLSFDTGFAVWSDRSYEIFRVPPGTPMTFERMLTLVHPDDRSKVVQAFEYEDGRPRPFASVEHRLAPDAEGRCTWVAVRAQTFFDGDGRPVRQIGTLLDVTAAKEAEASRLRLLRELGEERQRLSTVVEHLPAGLVLAEAPEGRISLVNSRAKEIIGQTVGQDLPADYAAYGGLHADGKPLPPEAYPMARALLQRETVDQEEVLYRKGDGTLTTLMVSAAPILQDGKQLGAVCMFQDISERKRLEAELVEAKRAADEASEAKSAFLANMSHEIRTPLGAILGYAELLVEPGVTPEERATLIDVVRRNGAELGRIIDDILDLSKVEAGRMDLETMRVPVAGLVSDVVALLGLRARERGLGLETRVARPFPETIQTDPTRLKQVLVNIVGNALKFTSEGLVTLTVDFAAPRLDFVVRDTGRGIPADRQAELFQPFTQSDASTTRLYGGTGLGLALSRRLARALGGDVTLRESIEGLGSTFVVSVDCGDLAGVPLRAGLDEPAPAAREPDAAPTRLDGVRILLAEDAPDNQFLVARHLRKSGAQVDVAGDGAEAYERALAGQHDLVLMDIQMPKLDGYQATRKLRVAGFAKPIVALTAHAMKQEIDRCYAAGADAHMAKPVDCRRLTRLVAECLSRARPGV